MLDYALRYASTGWKVFPVNGKIPRTPNGVKDATTNEQSIRSWWTEHPKAGIGLSTGEIAVLDVDPKNDGFESLVVLERTFGLLPDTLRSVTGSGGSHYFFKAKGRVKSRANIRIGGVQYSGIDVRGDGGYVVLPPSPHESGRFYEWDIGSPDTLADAPLYLYEQDTQPVVVAEEFWGNGIRNDRLTRLAGSLRARGFAEADLVPLLLLANEQRCRPPLPSDDVVKIAKSVSRYPAGGLIGSTYGPGRGEGSGQSRPTNGGTGSYGNTVPPARPLHDKRRKNSLRNGAWYLPRGR